MSSIRRLLKDCDPVCSLQQKSRQFDSAPKSLCDKMAHEDRRILVRPIQCAWNERADHKPLRDPSSSKAPEDVDFAYRAVGRLTILPSKEARLSPVADFAQAHFLAPSVRCSLDEVADSYEFTEAGLDTAGASSTAGLQVTLHFAQKFLHRSTFQLIVAIDDEACGFWLGEQRWVISFLDREASFHGASLADSLVRQGG